MIMLNFRLIIDNYVDCFRIFNVGLNEKLKKCKYIEK